MIKTEIKKCLFNFEMIVGILIVTGCFALGVSNDLRDYFKGKIDFTIFNSVYISIFGGIIGNILPILCVLPIINILIDESLPGYEDIILMRTTRLKYIEARIVSTILSGFIEIFLGGILFVLCLRLIGINFSVPGVYNSEYGLIEGTIYYKITEAGKPVLSVLLMMLIFSLMSISWSMLALLTSRYIKNKYALVIIPFLVHKLLIFICYPFKFLFYINPLTWNVFTNRMMNTAGGGLLFELIVQTIVTAVVSILFGFTLMRKYKHG